MKLIITSSDEWVMRQLHANVKQTVVQAGRSADVKIELIGPDATANRQPAPEGQEKG